MKDKPVKRVERIIESLPEAERGDIERIAYLADVNTAVVVAYLQRPRRIQRKRERGWRKPEGVVDVTRPGKWSNPFRVGYRHPVTKRPMSAADVVQLFAAQFDTAVSRTAQANRAAVQADLRGKSLMCWCKEGEPCHGDVLLNIANDEVCSD